MKKIDGSNKVSSDAQETGSNNLEDPGPYFVNVLRISLNTQVIGFLRGLMIHHIPQNMQSSSLAIPLHLKGYFYLKMKTHPILFEMIRQFYRLMTHLQKLSTWRT